MKKKKLFPKYILLDTALFVLVFALISGVLSLLKTTFREWVWVVFFSLTAIGIFAGILQLLLTIPKKTVKIILIVLFSVISLFAARWLALVALFSLSDKEHVVERDGETYLARVEGFLETDVYYYDYKGFLLQGKRALIEENYGNGSFDPFNCEWECAPRRTIYYDEQGKVIRVEEQDG